MDTNQIYINGESAVGSLYWYGANNLQGIRLSRKLDNLAEVRFPTRVVETIFGKYYLETTQGKIPLSKQRESRDGLFLRLPENYYLFNPSEKSPQAA